MRETKKAECAVCGIAFRPTNAYNQTCGEPNCQAFLVIHPELRAEKRCRKKMKPLLRPRFDLEGLIASRQAPCPDFHLGVERLRNSVRHVSVEEWERTIPSIAGVILDPEEEEEEGEDDNPWASTSKLIIGLYMEPESMSDLPGASIVFRVPRGRRVSKWIADELLGGSADNAPWDILMAWRCLCRQDHRVVYRTLEDFPATVGYHDACPQCRYAPVEVIRV